jgi:hypothetical protein
MTNDQPFEPDNPELLVRRLNRRIYVSAQRMKAFATVGFLAGFIGIVGCFTPSFPSWIVIFCFLFLPLQFFGFQKERRTMLACKENLRELEQPCKENVSQGTSDHP